MTEYYNDKHATDFDSVQEQLLMIAKSGELQNEKLYNLGRIAELEERNRLIGHEILRRLKYGTV